MIKTKFELNDIVKYKGKSSTELYKVVGTSQGLLFKIHSLRFPTSKSFTVHHDLIEIVRKFTKLEKVLK